MRRLAYSSLLVALLLAACGSPATEPADSTSSTTTSTTTTATTSSTTTTTSASSLEPESLEGRGRQWDSGRRYLAESFVVPLSFVVEDEGWGSTGAAGRWIDITYDTDQDGSVDATLTLIAHMPDRLPEEVLSAILGQVEETTASVAGAPPTTTGIFESAIQGTAVLITDLTTGESPSRNADTQCSRPRSQLGSDGPGFFLIDQFGTSPRNFGIPSCTTSRLWLLQLSGQTITAVGVSDDPDRFDELMPTLESFLATSLSIEG